MKNKKPDPSLLEYAKSLPSSKNNLVAARAAKMVEEFSDGALTLAGMTHRPQVSTLIYEYKGQDFVIMLKFLNGGYPSKPQWECSYTTFLSTYVSAPTWCPREVLRGLGKALLQDVSRIKSTASEFSRWGTEIVSDQLWEET